MTTAEHIEIFMSDNLPPASVSMLNSEATEFISALREKYPDKKFFITVNVKPGITEVERSKIVG